MTISSSANSSATDSTTTAVVNTETPATAVVAPAPQAGTFASFNLNAKIQASIKAQGYDTPTPIQAKAIPVVMAGRDVMGLAQTGTGKTAAFVLPILERISKNRGNKISALIIAPTRELAQQINEVVVGFARGLNIRSMTAFGGVSMGRQVRELRDGVDVVVGCPGRILDHLERRTMRLDGLEVLVLDEADQMFDMGFIPTVRQILKAIPRERQTLLFSATMPPDIRKLAHEILQKPETIQVGNSNPPTTVSHAIFPVPANLKADLLVKLLEKTDTDSVLVFTRTKHRAKRVSEHLKEKGFKATSLQGNLSQNQREIAMQGFRSGKYQILVATDIAARGIDISSISHVINYDIPDTAEAYTHRIGRTGRAAKTGDAYTLVTGEDTYMVRTIERALRTELERKTLPDFDYKTSRQPQHQNQRGGEGHNPDSRGEGRGEYNPRRNFRGGGGGGRSHGGGRSNNGGGGGGQRFRRGSGASRGASNGGNGGEQRAPAPSGRW